MTVEYKVHVSSGNDQDTHVVGRFHYDRGWGWGEAMYFNIQFGCSRCVTTGSQTGYFIEGVHKTETLTPPSPIFNTPAAGTKWSERFEISFWGGNSHGGVALKVLRRHSPPIRCDNIGYLNGINRGPGCVFPGATAVIGLERSRWPKSVALIERGWAEHGYGDYYHGNKLTRETSKSVARRNRRAAKPYCVNYTETCDEYPFAKTRQGCALRPDLCDTADVPAEQNSGSGGYVGTILTYARVLDGEGYWLFAYGSYG